MRHVEAGARQIATVRQLVFVAVIALGAFLLGAVVGMPPYRRADWPHWITGLDPEHPCRDTRQLVLARDARPSSIRWNEDGCRVVSGLWIDPYSGELISDPADLDVDHVVALQDAHRRGAAGWSRDRKRQYANDLRYRFHLLAVSASLNRAKGAKDASAWVPDRAYWCQWGQARATIAVLDRLRVPELERLAIASLVRTC